jgi:hypothetical protein
MSLNLLKPNEQKLVRDAFAFTDRIILEVVSARERYFILPCHRSGTYVVPVYQGPQL